MENIVRGAVGLKVQHTFVATTHLFFQGSFSFVYLNFNPLFLCRDVLFIMLTSKNNTLGNESRRGVKDYPENRRESGCRPLGYRHQEEVGR
jgi:hypothetical protein